MPASDVSHGSSYLYSPTGPRLPSQPQVVTAVWSELVAPTDRLKLHTEMDYYFGDGKPPRY